MVAIYVAAIKYKKQSFLQRYDEVYSVAVPDLVPAVGPLSDW